MITLRRKKHTLPLLVIFTEFFLYTKSALCDVVTDNDSIEFIGLHSSFLPPFFHSDTFLL